MPKVSRYFQMTPYDDDTAIIWHSVFGRPMLVTSTLANFLQDHSESGEYFTYEEMLGENCRADQDAISAIDFLRSARILLPMDTVLVERESNEINKLYLTHNDPCPCGKIKYLSLIMSEECNFRCKYCIHFANAEHRYNPEQMMSLEVAESSVEYYLDLIQDAGLEEGYINLGGGEPLLNWRTIVPLLAYIDMCKKQRGIPIKVGLNTNMALLTEKIAKILIDYDVEIAASLDGAKSGNDAVRLTKSLDGTYDQIMHGFNIMRDLGHPLDGFAMTVTEDNFAEVDTPLIDWAASLGMTEIRIDVDVIGAVKLSIDQIVSQLMKVRRYASEKGISVIGFWSRPAENMGLIPEEDDVGFCGAERGNSICVAPSGQVFPCGYSNYQLGRYTDIPTIACQRPYLDLLSRRSITNVKILCDPTCPILGFCRGGCMITREAAKNNPGKISRMCELYRAMTCELLRESAAE